MKFDDCNCPWHQGHIRQAMNACGYWELDVCRSGDYVIELCRWPEESAHNIRSGIDGDDIEWRAELVPQSSHWLYTGGKALDITEASINIDGRKYSAKVEDQNQSVKFEVSLEKGPAHLSSQFRLADGSTLGVYYVYVTYKS
jgi:hypothetical protein